MQKIKDKKQKLWIMFFTFCLLFFTALRISAEETYTFKTGISIDKVPKELYGTWRVSSKLISTDSESLYKESSVDLWNLSKTGNVITLENPFSGAKASITVNEVNGQSVKFNKIGAYDNNTKLTDTVQLTLGKEIFTGINYLKLDTISDVDGHVIKSETATYKLSGAKISGASIK